MLRCGVLARTHHGSGCTTSSLRQHPTRAAAAPRGQLQVIAFRGQTICRPQKHAAGLQRGARASRSAAVTVRNTLLARVLRIVRAYVGGSSDSLVASLERPELILTQALEDMNNDLLKARQAQVRVGTDQRLAEKRAQSARDLVATWQRRAEQAVVRGEDDLAREALRRKQAAAQELGLLEAQARDLAAAASTLAQAVKVLEGRVKEAARKEGALRARAVAAQAAAEQQAALQDLVNALPRPGTAWGEFERMEAKVGALEALAAATAEVNGSIGGGTGSGFLLRDPALDGGMGGADAAGRRLAALEEEARLDEEMKALRQGLAARQQEKSLPPFQR